MKRIALSLEYAGDAFLGWQTQPNGLAGQDYLERALSIVADGKLIQTICAGRTDAGVHASMQLVHFDIELSRPMSAWVRGANAHLPDSMVVTWAGEVSQDFHARFSAKARHYRYILLNRSTRPALWSKRVGWFHGALDLDAMQQAARSLLGEHDFSSFRASSCQAHSPIRTIYKIDICAQGEYFIFDLHGDGFLHHMVRNIVGALIYVGKGKYSAIWLSQLLAAKNRKLAPPTFSPAGLYFVGVDYDDHWGLPQGGHLYRAPQIA